MYTVLLLMLSNSFQIYITFKYTDFGNGRVPNKYMLEWNVTGKH